MRRISTRLAVSFLLVALLPTLPLSLVVRDLLDRRFGPAIADPLERALEAGLAESRAHLHERREQLREQAAALTTAAPVVLVDGSGRSQPTDALNAILAVRPDLLAQASALPGPAGAPAVAEADRIDDVLVVVAARKDGSRQMVLQMLPASMVGNARELGDGLALLRAVRGEQGRVVLSFVGPFLLVYGVLILVALAAALLWTRRVVSPLEALVGATRRVAGGDFEFRVEANAPGEVGELVHAFDAMIGRLAQQRRDVARLERAAAWRGMARTLAHEIKNPLTPIVLAVEQIRDGYRGDDARYRKLVDECAAIVGEEVESLRRLVREFGDFARLPRPEPRPGDLADLGRDLAQLFGGRLALSGVESPLPGWFDEAALRRALINLIDNGLAACEQAGAAPRVALSFAAAGSGAEIEVRDAGIGIPAEHLEHIFEPDFTTKSSGMGLGLAITQNIVAGHGGSVRVASTPGQGTVFTLALPLTRVGADPGAEQEVSP